MQALISQLNTYRNEYYNQNNPSVSDTEYDRLFDELKALEDKTGIILSHSPTQEAGYTVVSKLKKVTHSIPLLSLNKTKSQFDIEKFIGTQPALLMLKYDGLTVEIIYENGEMVQASTRGDGYIGEDITHNAKTFIGLPMTIPYKEHLKVVGEAIILKNDFDEINSKLSEDEKYKTPRNLVSGSVRQLDSKLCAERKVRFALWDILEGLSDIVEYMGRFDLLKETATYGFKMPQLCTIAGTRDLLELPVMIENLKRYADKTCTPIDGLVIKYDDIEYSKSLGSTSHHNNDGLALKFSDETAETILREVEWSMGRMGNLTPVAIFDTVDLDNTDVSRASLHNISIVEKLELGIGDTITVAKSNRIIPQIQDNLTRSNTLEIPDSCPICGGKTEIIQDNDSKVLTCTNQACKGKLLGKFVHFCSKKCMNIEGLSEATLEKFIDLGWLNEYQDIYSLLQYKDEIIAMEGFGRKSYTKLMTSIENSRNVKLENFITALGIPNIGKTASKAISKFCNGEWNKFKTHLFNNTDWRFLPDFGDVANDALHSFCKREYVKWEISLAELMNFEKVQTAATTNNPFQNKTVVVTGTLKNFTRISIQEKLEALGAKVSGSVSKNTDYLIAGESAGSKLTKAQSLDVKILTEDEFIEENIKGTR